MSIQSQKMSMAQKFYNGNGQGGKGSSPVYKQVGQGGKNVKPIYKQNGIGTSKKGGQGYPMTGKGTTKGSGQGYPLSNTKGSFSGKYNQ